MKKIPRILISAPASGSGKTMITCALLEAFSKSVKKITSFKCGPDYIDPMFHKEVLGIDSYNLDAFLCGREGSKRCLMENTGEAELAVIEGVMGYYDGLGGISVQASAYDVAGITGTPVVLVIDCRGMSVSVVPYLQGFVNYKEDSRIKGVILNRLSPMMYGRMKEMIERETNLTVYGYVPVMKDALIESRHLGLCLPQEEKEIKSRIEMLGEKVSQTIDLEGILELAQSAGELETGESEENEQFSESGQPDERTLAVRKDSHVRDEVALKIAVAMDDAFCFIYKDNLKILEKLGAEVVPFSPIYDKHLPEGISGLILYGGYPELHAKALSENVSMRQEIRTALENGLPCMAECGGFMYLKETLTTQEGKAYPMAGVLKGESHYTPSLKRFGYAVLSGGTVFGMEVGEIPVHEFHYFDTDDYGDAFVSRKPLSDRSWKCMVSTDTLFAGYPHIHYGGNPRVAEAFMEACRKRKEHDVRTDHCGDCSGR